MTDSEIRKDGVGATEYHTDIIDEVRARMVGDTAINDMAELFKILADATRVRILSAISVSEMRVCDIAALLCMSNSAISHQLRVMKQAHVVRSRRSGKEAIYSVADAHIGALMRTALEHSCEK
jgi:ArsR family transcriptional regulator